MNKLARVRNYAQASFPVSSHYFTILVSAHADTVATNLVFGHKIFPWFTPHPAASYILLVCHLIINVKLRGPPKISFFGIYPIL